MSTFNKWMFVIFMAIVATAFIYFLDYWGQESAWSTILVLVIAAGLTYLGIRQAGPKKP